jgi:hypothetical protein
MLRNKNSAQDVGAVSLELPFPEGDSPSFLRLDTILASNNNARIDPILARELDSWSLVISPAEAEAVRASTSSVY